MFVLDPSVKHVRRANAFAAFAWLAMVPVSVVTGWIYSIAFTGACSIYANFISHAAAQRADVPDPDVIRRLNLIIRLLWKNRHNQTKEIEHGPIEDAADASWSGVGNELYPDDGSGSDHPAG